MAARTKPTREELKIDDELRIDDALVGPDDDLKNQDYKMAFKLLDKDGNGQLSVAELQEVFTNLNFKFTERQLKKMVQSIDKDGNGEIDLDEFMLMMKDKVSKRAKKYNLSYEDELKEAFNVFDKDGNGRITASELAETMKALGENLSEEDIQFMMSEVDENNDKEIDFSEFRKMMAQGPQ